MKCKFCKEKFKNQRGVSIHWHYCFVKSFTGMDIKSCSDEEANALLSNDFFIPNGYYPFNFFPFIKKGEVGMFKNSRYTIHE